MYIRWYNKLRYRKINMLMTRSFSNFKQYKNDFCDSFFVYSLNGVSLDRCNNTRILMNIPTNSIHIHLTIVGNIGKTRNTTKTTCILIKLDDIKCINNNIYSTYLYNMKWRAVVLERRCIATDVQSQSEFKFLV